MIKKNRRKILVFINNRYLPDHNGAAIAFHRTAKFYQKNTKLKFIEFVKNQILKEHIN